MEDRPQNYPTKNSGQIQELHLKLEKTFILFWSKKPVYIHMCVFQACLLNYNS